VLDLKKKKSLDLAPGSRFELPWPVFKKKLKKWPVLPPVLDLANHVGKNKAKKRLENAYLGEIEPVPALFEQIENNAPSRNKSWLNVTRIFIDFSKKIRIGSVSLIFPRRYNKKKRAHVTDYKKC